MRLGFACAWDPVPELTWSHTPWQLRAALRTHCEVRDIDLSYPRAVRSGLRLAYARRRNGRVTSLWKHSAAARTLSQARLRRADSSEAVDAIVEMGDIGPTRTPYFILQDLSYDLLLDVSAAGGIDLQFASLSRRTIEHLRDRQRRVYASAAGVLAMSQWFADHLVRVSGVPGNRVHVVHPGANLPPITAEDLERNADRRLAGPRRRLLFIGKDFERKGGRQAVEALRLLRQEVDPAMSLTVAGPAVWPLNSPMPDGVDFRGHVPLAEIAHLYDTHDLFVLPSQFEAFGIVFVEALARGLPCVGRDDFAMPEIISRAKTGALVSGSDPRELADVIASARADDALVRGARDAAAASASHYTWDRAARQVLDAVRSVGS